MKLPKYLRGIFKRQNPERKPKDSLISVLEVRCGCSVNCYDLHRMDDDGNYFISNIQTEALFMRKMCGKCLTPTRRERIMKLASEVH